MGFRLFMKNVENKLAEGIDLEMIDGLLLSDASLERMENHNTKTAFLLSQSMKNKELVEKINEYFIGKGMQTHTKTSERKDGMDYRLRTNYYSVFGRLWNIWYPSGIKIVPKTIKLTPKSLAYLFMGDGSSTKVRNSVVVYIATQGFDDESVIFLKNKLMSDLGINIKYNRCKTTKKKGCGLILRLSEKNEVVKFMNLIKPYILKTFDYKIKYPIMDGRKAMRENMKIKMTYVVKTMTRDRRGRFLRV